MEKYLEVEKTCMKKLIVPFTPQMISRWALIEMSDNISKMLESETTFKKVGNPLIYIKEEHEQTYTLLMKQLVSDE